MGPCRMFQKSDKAGWDGEKRMIRNDRMVSEVVETSHGSLTWVCPPGGQSWDHFKDV